MIRSRAFILAAGLLAAACAAVARAYHEAVALAARWPEDLATFAAGVFALAFPSAPRLPLDTGWTSPPMVLGLVQTRSYRSRRLAFIPTGRTGAPLTAAFATV